MSAFLQKWTDYRKKKLFEAEITFVVKKHTRWEIFLNREFPVSWSQKILLCQWWRRNKRVLTLPLDQGVLNQKLFSPGVSGEELLVPGQKIGVIYWTHTGEIVKILLMTETDDFLIPDQFEIDFSESTEEDEEEQSQLAQLKAFYIFQ